MKIAAILVSAALLPPAALRVAAADGPAGPAPVVATVSGKVQGKVAGGVEAYLGIPFAAAPTGDGRWRAPREAAAWPDIRQATQYGPACPQLGSIDSPRTEDEDCLIVNVQRPIGTRADARLPVYVYVYGGGLTGGSANNEDLDALVRQNGIVGVTMNYRLGALGFLAHPALADQAGQSGNYGLMDQQAALRWVKANIAAFGGDPARVTIGGESAGGRAVLAHLVSPGSRGLFAQAIVQSASDSTVPRKDAEATGVDFARELGCAGEGAEAAACLRAKPVAALIEHKAPSRFLTGGTEILPQAPYPTLMSGTPDPVPVLIGGQRDEWRGLMTEWPTRSVPEYTRDQYLKFVRDQFGDKEAGVLAVYPWPDDPTRYTGTNLVAKIRSESGGLPVVGSCSTQKLADALASRAPTYRYEFAHSQGPGWFGIPGYVWGAGHATELAYLFPSRHNGANNGAALNGAEQRLSDEMVRYWGAFIRGGDPNVDGQAPWARYQPDGTMLSLRAGGQSAAIPVAAFKAAHACSFWDAIR